MAIIVRRFAPPELDSLQRNGMANNSVLYQRQGHVGRITLNRPNVRNVIDDNLAAELRDACQSAIEDDEAYVVVIVGEGPVFCSGAAPVEASASEMPVELESRRVASSIAAITKPVIAALQGDTAGQGLELALACDLRIAAQGTRFALDQIKSGQLPWDGGTQRLPRLVNKGVALHMILTGESIDTDEALRVGLINAVVETSDLHSRAQELAEQITSMAPIATAYAKEAVNKGMDMTLEQGIRLEADLAVLLHTSEDRAEGLSAFLNKRQPTFKGK